MTLDTAIIISPNLHRSLYKYAVKKFVEDELGDSFAELSNEYQLDTSDELGYSRFLDRCISEEKIQNEQVLKFIINELNYGRQRNMYISFLMDASFLKDKDKIIEKIKRLEVDGANKVSDLPFINEISNRIDRGAKKLVYADTLKNDKNEISSIRLVIGTGIVINGSDCNNYIAIEINLDLNLLVIKLRNWKDEIDEEHSLQGQFNEYKLMVKEAFNLGIPLSFSTVQKLLRNMASDLTEKVLGSVKSEVDSKIKANVNSNVVKWLNSISDRVLPPKDVEIVEDSVLNNFYRLYMQHEIGKLSNEELKTRFKVDGYPTYVKFTDDTIGEARAKSSDPKESLLDTSVYYDLKARLDNSEQIKVITIYWIDFPILEHFGTTFNAEAQERFKVNIRPNFFNKEISDYVLRKIKMYQGT